MLSNLFRSVLSQTSQKAASVPHAAKRIDASQLKLVSGGLPRGGWPIPESMSSAQLPRGGWA